MARRVITYWITVTLLGLAAGARSTAEESKFGRILSFSSLIDLTERNYTRIDYSKYSFFVEVDNEVKVKETDLLKRIENFTFEGNSVSLIDKLNEKGFRISHSKVFARGEAEEAVITMKFEKFSGTILDLFVQSVSAEYKKESWTIYAREKDGHLLVKFHVQ